MFSRRLALFCSNNIIFQIFLWYFVATGRSSRRRFCIRLSQIVVFTKSWTRLNAVPGARELCQYEINSASLLINQIFFTFFVNNFEIRITTFKLIKRVLEIPNYNIIAVSIKFKTHIINTWWIINQYHLSTQNIYYSRVRIIVNVIINRCAICSQCFFVDQRSSLFEFKDSCMKILSTKFIQSLSDVMMCNQCCVKIKK